MNGGMNGGARRMAGALLVFLLALAAGSCAGRVLAGSPGSVQCDRTECEDGDRCEPNSGGNRTNCVAQPGGGCVTVECEAG